MLDQRRETQTIRKGYRTFSPRRWSRSFSFWNCTFCRCIFSGRFFPLLRLLSPLLLFRFLRLLLLLASVIRSRNIAITTTTTSTEQGQKEHIESRSENVEREGLGHKEVERVSYLFIELLRTSLWYDRNGWLGVKHQVIQIIIIIMEICKAPTLRLKALYLRTYH